MRVFIRRPDGSTFRMDLWKHITLRELKGFVFIECPLLLYPFDLICNGQKLTDEEKTFEELGIQQGDVFCVWHNRLENADEKLRHLQSPEGIPKRIPIDPIEFPEVVDKPLYPIAIQSGSASRLLENDDHSVGANFFRLPPYLDFLSDFKLEGRELTSDDIDVFCRYYVLNTGDIGEEFASRFPEAALMIYDNIFIKYLDENSRERNEIVRWLENLMIREWSRQEAEEDRELALAMQRSLETIFLVDEPKRMARESVLEEPQGAESLPVREEPQAEESGNVASVKEDIFVWEVDQMAFHGQMEPETVVVQTGFFVEIPTDVEEQREEPDARCQREEPEVDASPPEPVKPVRKGRGRGRGPSSLRNLPKANPMVSDEKAAEISRLFGESSRAVAADRSAAEFMRYLNERCYEDDDDEKAQED